MVVNMKTHLAIPFVRFGEQSSRSLCGRSSGRVVNVDTIETHQNLGDVAEVTCAFCRRLITAGRHLAATGGATHK